jgi:alpha-beta hydrolase superfamily lysophospholipase
MKRQSETPREHHSRPLLRVATRRVVSIATALVILAVTNRSLLAMDPSRYLPPPDASYTASEVRVRSFEAHSLGGTLTLPDPRTAHGHTLRFPAVILITGRSAQDRDGASSAPDDAGGAPTYRPFYDLADTLSRRGIATLRLDDRGVGASTGSLDSATTFDRSYDMRAALEYLRKRPDIDPRRVALLGISEGATIAGMIALLDEQIGPIVLMGPPSATGREIVAWQRGLATKPGLSVAAHDSIVNAGMQDWDVRAAKDPWLNFFSSYDPIATAHRVRTPVLILQGDLDAIVPPDGAQRLAAAFREGGSDVTVKMFKDLDHSFLRPADFEREPGPSSRYRLPAEVRGSIADWLATRLGPATEAAPSRSSKRSRSRAAR